LKGYDVVCSDFGGPSSLAAPLHERYGVSQRVEYCDVNATEIDFPTSSFDVVVFKSILGGIGTYHNVAALEQALKEILRVLKPGGILLFAENLLGSKFHRFARSHFVKWGKRWHYMPLSDMEELLSRFGSYQIRSYGYLSCVKKDFAPFVFADRFICKRELSQSYYMGYGHALKAR
jgi:ubiquinone/menaquinone biosynthesis C-methylase UbiE